MPRAAEQSIPESVPAGALSQPGDYAQAMERLVSVVQALSQAQDLDTVMEIVRHAARELTGADGATFVLRDNDQCYYAEEDAIAPLWKGRRFPLHTCISGWAMLNRQPAVIEDIYADPRIPDDAYRPTFVKSLAMVPIRTADPVGAIGNYWADRRLPSERQVALLQMLANFTATAMTNLELYNSLRDKVAALETSNAELDAFAWAASHDLKAPLRAIDYLAQKIGADIETGDTTRTRARLETLRQRTSRMEKLLASMLDYARTDAQLAHSSPEMAGGATIIEDIRLLSEIPAGFELVFSDAFAGITLPRVPAQRVFGNLVSNAVRHHDRESGRIVVDAEISGTHYVVTVTDDGPGISADYRDRIFRMFQTLQPRDRAEGSGMGLAMVRKTLAAFGAEIALAETRGRGAAFRIDWPRPAPDGALP
jgi:signal transduction histidine kinase